MPIDYAEIKDALNVKQGHVLHIVNAAGDALELFRVDHASHDQAQLRCTQVKDTPGRWQGKPQVLTVDLIRGSMRRAGSNDDVPLQLMAVL